MTRIDTLELFDGVARAMNANPDWLAAFGDIDVMCVLRAGRETERVRLAVTAGHCTAMPLGTGDDIAGSILVEGDVRWWSELLAGADPTALLAWVLPMQAARTLRKTG
jgi:hypothetical protein